MICNRKVEDLRRFIPEYIAVQNVPGFDFNHGMPITHLNTNRNKIISSITKESKFKKCKLFHLTFISDEGRPIGFAMNEVFRSDLPHTVFPSAESKGIAAIQDVVAKMMRFKSSDRIKIEVVKKDMHSIISKSYSISKFKY